MNGYCKKKTVIDDAKTDSEQLVQKSAKATGYLIGNKIADKITSVDETKSKEKEDERQEIYIPSEKRQQIIDELRLFTKKLNTKTYNLIQHLIMYLDLLLKNE